jgi:hypothetical protein
MIVGWTLGPTRKPSARALSRSSGGGRGDRQLVPRHIPGALHGAVRARGEQLPAQAEAVAGAPERRKERLGRRRRLTEMILP